MGRINRNLDETGQVGRAVLDEMGEQTETLGKVGGRGVATTVLRGLGGEGTEWQKRNGRETKSRREAYQPCVAGAVIVIDVSVSLRLLHRPSSIVSPLNVSFRSYRCPSLPLPLRPLASPSPRLARYRTKRARS